jgi:hypothetical protein
VYDWWPIGVLPIGRFWCGYEKAPHGCPCRARAGRRSSKHEERDGGGGDGKEDAQAASAFFGGRVVVVIDDRLPPLAFLPHLRAEWYFFHIFPLMVN